MDEVHKEILRKSRVKIVEDLIIDEILDKLLEKGVFTTMMLEYIMAEKARPDRVRKLIDDLQRRGPDAYDKFILCLREGGHAHLANYILNVEAEINGWSLPYSGKMTSRKSGSDLSSQSLHPIESIPSLLHVQETVEVESMDDSDESDQNTIRPVQDAQMEGDEVPDIYAQSTSQHITGSSNKGYTGGKDQYSMESSPRGLVLIINNRQFEKQKHRPGTEYDGRMLQDMFFHMGFAVDQICDITAFEMKRKLKELAELPQLEYVDSLVVVILSHGQKDDTICGVDGSVVKYDEVTELFDSKNCPLLHHKPKLFIINACRGDKEDTGSQGSSIQTDRVYPDIDVMKPRPKGNQSQPIPTLQDMIIAASTLPGHVSWRDDNKGSWFIQAIVDVFQEFCKTHHILDMLVRNPSEPVTVAHNTSGEDKGNEGVVQTYQIPTRSLNRYKMIYISMRAVNGAGLRSPMLHSLFKLHYGGLMELVRRCSAHTCLGHCVCAPQEGKCDLNGVQCNNISNPAEHTLHVIDIQNLEDPTNAPQIRYSAMDSVLAARWIDDDHASWYEWSVGESSYDEPKGVFSASQENVWHHVGEERYMIYSLPRSKDLHNGHNYSFFVRAWYNGSSYAIFKSLGVYIDSKPPRTTNVKGINVKETIGNLTKEVDFAKLGDKLYVDWTSKFRDAKTGGINMFRLYISTYPGGHDVYVAEDDIYPTVSRYFLPLQNLIPSTRYYANIQAYGKSGLHTTITSDGFMIDVDPPEPGMVYDGQGWRDMEFQNSSLDVRASWHSFSDLDSGISHYMWCSTTEIQSTICSIMSWKDMGLFTNSSHKLNISVVDGTRIVQKIYAIDAVGHTSTVVVSDGVTVDSTAAVSEDRSVFLENIVQNPSFETDYFGKTCMEIEHMANCETHPITGWTSAPGSCVWLATTSIHHAQDGNSFLVVQGSVTQTIQGLEKGQKYRVVFYTSHLPFSLSVISNKEGFINIDGTRHVFFLYNKVHRQDNRHTFQTIMIWHQHTFFFQARSPNITLEIGSTDRSTGIAIDNIHVQKNILRTDPSKDKNYHVQAHTVFVHDWTSVHASWNFVDPDSPIVDYSWAIGYIVGGSQLQDFRSVGLRTFAFNSSLKLKHNSRVHVTVVATNAVGLKTVSYSEPIIVDLTPPVLEVINDGKGQDIDFQDTSIIIANWDVNDPESGIKECKWSIGTAPGENDLQNFTKAEQGTWTFTQQFQISDVGDKTIYVNVRCENGAGLVSSRSSDGVHVFGSVLSADSLEISVMGTSNSVYIPHNYFHADVSDVRIRWSGFKDDLGIEICEVILEGPGTEVTALETVDTQGYMCTDFKGLHLKDGLHRISITGINSIKMRTETKMGNFTVLTKPPIKHDGRTLLLSWNPSGGSVTASWNSLFSSEYPLQYEVSAGTVQGGSDIIQWQETRENQLIFFFDKEAIGPAGKDVFVSVRAISPSGLYETANAQILLTS